MPGSGEEGVQVPVIIVSSAEKEKKKKTSPPNLRGLPKIGFILQNKHIPLTAVYFLCPTGASIPTEMRDR